MSKLAAQFKLLRKLRRMSETELRKLHRRKFKHTPWDIRIPSWMHRSVVERRLFMLYCLYNYHYPKDHPIYKEFKRKALHILSRAYLEGIDPEAQTREVLRDRERFTASHIRNMPINEVDRMLTGLSLFVEGDEKTRRKVLYEWFHGPDSRHVKQTSHNGEKFAVRGKGTINNKYKLRDLILSNPTLPFNDFVRHFGHEMPTVSRASYNNTRSLLRKAGYDIPVIPKGPTDPVVVRGQYGHVTRAKMLNDTALQREEDYGEEP